MGAAVKPARWPEAPGVDVMPLPGDRVAISGPFRRVAAVVEEARRAGVLLSATAPAPDGVGGVVVTAKLAVVRRPVNRGRDGHSSVRCRVWLAVAVVVLAVCGGVAWALGAFLAWAWANAMGIGACVALAILVWAGLGQAGVCCPGIHCPGCAHQ